VVAVTAAIAVPQLVRDRAGTTPAAAPSTPAEFAVPTQPFTFTFGPYDVGRLHVDRPRVVSTAYEIAPVTLSGQTQGKTQTQGNQRLYAYLVLYRPGAYQSTGVQNLTVNGRPAVESRPRDGVNHRRLAWQYADNAWATLDSFGDPDTPSAQDLRDLAAGLRPAQPAAARIPFRMSYVPAGFRPVVVGSHVMAGLDGIAGVDEGDFGGAIFAKPAPRATGLTEPWNETGGTGIPGSFEIFIVPNANSNQALKPGEARPAQPRCIKRLCNAWSADGKVNIQVASEGDSLPEVEMIKVLNGITLADLTNDSTWPEAATATAP
jgi:hypothetical protein